MWDIYFTDDYGRRHRRFEKKRRRELQAVLSNLNRFFEALRQGTEPKQIQGGWIHPEPMDIVAIDQKGGGKKKDGKNLGKGLKQTRLYVFPDTQTETLHVILLGDKDTQKGDIAFCKKYVETLRREQKAEENE